MKRLVLAGAGHAHAQVLKDWAAAPLPGVEVVVVSPSALAPYSGMVPGWLAGHYGFDDICIDFAALASTAGARWVSDEVAHIDADRRVLTMRGTSTLDYDVLSLNIGSSLTPPALPEGAPALLLCLRPLGELRDRWETTLARLAALDVDQALTITAVGGGAAGVESLLAVRRRLLQMWPRRPVHARLISRGSTLLPGLAPRAVQHARRALSAARVGPLLNSGYSPPTASTGSVDLVLWATGAEAHPWQRNSGLAVSEAGYFKVDRWLRSTSHPNVHAAGDCAAWAEPLPKAGVFAVRMGPVLSHNLRAALGGESPRAYQPQRHVLALLGTGDRRAIAAWGPWAAEGAWVWRWKEHIDRSFVRRYNRIGRSSGGDGLSRVPAALTTTKD